MRALILLMLLSAGCVSTGEKLDVSVKAFGKEDIEVTPASPICFVADTAEDDDEMAEKVVEACTNAAKVKGLPVVEKASGAQCQAVKVSWKEGDRNVVDLGWKTVCSSSQYYSSCSTFKESSHFYLNSIWLYVIGPEENKPRHRIFASTAAERRGIKQPTAIALCRAALQDFPANVDTRYEARTDLREGDPGLLERLKKTWDSFLTGWLG